MPRPLLIVSQSDSLIQIVDINLYTEWQKVQIQISWRSGIQCRPRSDSPSIVSDLGLHCLLRSAGPNKSKYGIYIVLDKKGNPDDIFRISP